MAVVGHKIFKLIRMFSNPSPYVENKHPLRISIPQDKGKLAKILAASPDDVGFSKLHKSAKAPRTCNAPRQSVSRVPAHQPLGGARSPGRLVAGNVRTGN